MPSFRSYRSFALSSRLTFITCLGGMLLLANDLPSAVDQEEFKRLLRERYDQKTLYVALPGLHCGEYVHALPTLNYFHYAGGLPVPGSRQSMQQIDERTFRGKPGTLNITKVEKGEAVKVMKFYVRGDNVELILSPTDIGRLEKLDVGKASTKTNTGLLGQTTNFVPPAFRFFFYFDKATTLAQGNVKDVVAEIDKYFVSREKMQSAERAERDVRIDPGMSEEEVLKKLGPPQKSIRVGAQTLLKYPDFTVVVNQGKVAEVKIN